MKRCCDLVRLKTDGANRPHRFFWRGQLYRVINVEERWRYVGQWWFDGKSHKRSYFRVTARAAHNRQIVTFQLYEQFGQWTVSGLYD